MPEYLAPGVYVEEIDTGSKPIEGVSTSTAGMLGVTERGPVNVPILITSFGEYVRWFGERLNIDDFSNSNDPHCYLPHAVEGFFINGGKRVFVVRVLDGAATRAETFLFARGTVASASTQLLRSVSGNSADIYLANDISGAIAADEYLQIGEGSEAEYRKLSAPGTANDVPLRLPLAATHNPTTPVSRLDPAPVANGGALDLATEVNPGDTRIELNDATTLNAVGGDLLRIGDPASNHEYVFTREANATTNEVTLRLPLMLSHKAGAGAVQLMTSGTQIDATTLGEAAAKSEAVLFVPVADHGNYTTAGDFIQITDGDETEVRQIGTLNILALGVEAYAQYAAGAVVEAVSLADADVDKLIVGEVQAGANVISLDNRMNLSEGDLVRIRTTADADVEYVTIMSIPNRTLNPDAGNIILAASLQRDHHNGMVVHKQSTSLLAAPSAVAVALTTPRNSAALVISGDGGFAANMIVRVNPESEKFYFHRLAAVAVAITSVPVTLDNPLLLPHSAASPVVARKPLLFVQALDAGAWGNRLRVIVQDQTPPLVNTKIRNTGDGLHIKLDAASGIEAGTILQRTDATGVLIDSPFKVIKVDRQNDFQLTLDTALPGGSVVGDRVRSLEFQIDVILLRQPDAAVPTRNETVLDSESFRSLSMDPRHSRYIEKVIGTIFTPGADNDDAGRPLRLSDRRSEGESRYIRVQDQATTTADLESIRTGPEPLFDVLLDGRQRPARRTLVSGNDSIATIIDDTYIGADNPEPLKRTGLYSLRNEEEISIIACPGRTRAGIQSALIDHCELMRYRFAVLDGPPPPNDSLNDVQVQRQQFDTKYAAIYHPWLLIPDPYPENLAQIANYSIPPSGHTLGIYARTDIDRGVHKAPANEVVRGILGLQRLLNKGEQDILNPYPVNINVIRDFRPNNRGIRVWGGRVITSDPDWKYVNVRRLLIFIENSIDRGLQWVVFEPNAEPLWARVTRTISNFLTTVWRNGALEGTKREEAYFVKCDRTTMTQTDIDNGRLICVIGVAPVKPAEFVIIRIGLWTAHAED